YANVTKADVLRVYKQYIKGHHAVIMSVVPNGKPEMIAAKDNFKTPTRALLTEQVSTSADELQLRKAKDTFDRSKIPVAVVAGLLEKIRGVRSFIAVPNEKKKSELRRAYRRMDMG
ncbi:hypothetical protein IIC68_04040, partial [archaeon]|nr:hypothetical protein [archaeon]